MKVHAIAGWLISRMDDDTKEAARAKISNEGVYSAIRGRWWIRITRSRGDHFGQVDALGTGRIMHMMEDILHLKIPQATMESHHQLIEAGKLRLPMLLEAPGIPDLAVTECLFNRVAQYRLKSEFKQIEVAELWD